MGSEAGRLPENAGLGVAGVPPPHSEPGALGGSLGCIFGRAGTITNDI